MFNNACECLMTSAALRERNTQLNVFVAAVGKLVAYDTDGDGDFDVEDAKVLLGKLIYLHLTANISADHQWFAENCTNNLQSSFYFYNQRNSFKLISPALIWTELIVSASH